MNELLIHNDTIKNKIFTIRGFQVMLDKDLEKHNSQYSSIKIKKFNSSHDRFLIVDDNDVYHIGASLKNLGKKWFAFSRLNIESFDILSRLDKVLL
jgi:hypothetical protein